MAKNCKFCADVLEDQLDKYCSYTCSELDTLSDKTGRSNRQTSFLFDLVDGDLTMLKSLESQLKNCFVSSCPADKDEVNVVMEMVPKMKKYNF